MAYAHITGLGMAIPARVLGNKELADRFETTEEWIIGRTGIKERRVASPDESTSVLATQAARNALAMANIPAGAIDLIIVATSSPDYLCTPATACLVQNNLGARNAGAFDLNAACTGFLYALTVGTQSIRSGDAGTVLVVGSDTYSRSIVNCQDRNTSILFGDGAGAVVLQARELCGGLISTFARADGSGEDILKVPAGGSASPFNADVLGTNSQYLRMDGKATFMFAVEAAVASIKCVLDRVGLAPDSVDRFVPHQANRRIIQAVAAELSIPLERFFINIDRYGNTSAASIPIALNECNAAGHFKSGNRVVCFAFGGGLNSGASILEWTRVPALDEKGLEEVVNNTVVSLSERNDQ